MTLHEALNPLHQPSPVRLENFTREDLARLFGRFGFTQGAEIGVMTGEYSRVLYEHIPGLRLCCVDSWAWGPENKYWARQGPKKVHQTNYERARACLAPYDVVFMRMTSLEGAAVVPDGSLDFVYVDASHDYDSCLADLEAWSPKVRRGGIVAGDDYRQGSSRARGVIGAVDDFVAAHGIPECFLTTDDTRTMDMETLIGSYPSFFWEQP